MDENLNPQSLSEVISLDDVIKTYYLRAYVLCNYDKQKTAKYLKISYRTSRNYSKKFDVPKKPKPTKIEAIVEKPIKNQIVIPEKQIDIDFGYRDVTPQERDDWYNRDRF